MPRRASTPTAGAGRALRRGRGGWGGRGPPLPGPRMGRGAGAGPSRAVAVAAGAGAGAGGGGQRSVAELNAGIADFYDESSELWEGMWGEHMHHGYYPGGKFRPDHRQAQVDMIDRVLDWAGVERVGRFVDVGCGIGGSSRHLARRFAGASGQGITLSPNQAARANQLSAEQGLGDRVAFQVADALAQPFEGGQFDLVWSLESGEHMPDKARFLGELARVAAPGGRIVVVTWCHRVLEPGEAGLRADEQALLDRICDAYYLPPWASVAEYERHARALGLEGVRVADWSEEVSPFWSAVIQTALSLRGVAGLFKAGRKTIRGALVMPLMSRGLAKGTIKFNCFTCTVPAGGLPGGVEGEA